MSKMTARSIHQCLNSGNYTVVGSWVDIRMVPKFALLYYSLPRVDMDRADQFANGNFSFNSRNHLTAGTYNADQVARFATGLWSPLSRRYQGVFQDGYVEKHTMLLRFKSRRSAETSGLFTMQLKKGLSDHSLRNFHGASRNTVLIRRADKRAAKTMSHSMGVHPYSIDLSYYGWLRLNRHTGLNDMSRPINQVHIDPRAPSPRIRLINPNHLGRPNQILGYKQFQRYFPAPKFSFTCL